MGGNKMKLKKFLGLGLAVAMAFSLVACGSEAVTETPATEETAVTEETEAVEEVEATEEVAVEGSAYQRPAHLSQIHG